MYIKNNLANNFIRFFKSFAGVPIFFDIKSDKNLRLYIDYQDFNNLIIKNWYSISLVGKLLDWLCQAQHFTHLNLTNTYYQMRIREGSKWKIIFRIQYGYFEYQIMLFSLTNILAIFQNYINKILAEKLNVFFGILMISLFILRTRRNNM